MTAAPIDALPDRTARTRCERPAILHLTYREGLSSVFMAQVARPMGLVRGRGYPVDIGIAVPIGEFFRPRARKAWGARRRELVRAGLTPHRLPSPPSRARKLWDEAALLGSFIGRRERHRESVIVHCRNTEATALASRAVGADTTRIVFDCRGVEGPEYLYSRGYSPEDAPADALSESRRLDRLQRAAADASSHMICVSHAMKTWIAKHWGIGDDKITVVPCCTEIREAGRVDAARKAMRDRLGLQHRLVVVYCGSMAAWQVPHKAMGVARAIMQLHPDAHLLGITQSPSSLAAAAAEAGIESSRITLISVPQNQVADYLAGGDIGLLIRDESLVNAVASPVKFAEYLAAGLPVLLTRGIGDYSDATEHAALGCVLDTSSLNDANMRRLADFIETLAAEQDTIRRRCMDYAKRNLNWTTAVDSLCAIYDRLGESHGAARLHVHPDTR